MDGKLEGIGWVSGRARHHKEALTDAKILSDTINGSYTNSICQINIPEKMERSLRVVKDGQRQKYKGQQTQNPGYNDTFNRKRPITYLKMSWNVTNGSLPY